MNTLMTNGELYVRRFGGSQPPFYLYVVLMYTKVSGMVPYHMRGIRRCALSSDIDCFRSICSKPGGN